jgi:hypothetical protein
MGVVDQQRLRRYHECPAGSCEFPFIGMGTQNSWQRSAMTVNHGTFYIDTSISQPTQALSRSKLRLFRLQHKGNRRKQPGFALEAGLLALQHPLDSKGFDPDPALVW